MKTTVLCITLTAVLALSGCSPLEKYEPVFDRYYSTTLKLSTSADVLAMIQEPDTELLSQSESVVAAWGVEGKKDRTHWFNMVAFDEEQMNAVRKYGFILEERNWWWNSPPAPALRLDGAMVMDPEILEAAYASKNEKQVEVLKAVKKAFSADAGELTFDSRSLRNSTDMVKQALKSVLTKLDHSPAYAAKLPLYEGVAFDHPTLGESYIRMLIEADIVKIKIKCGKAWFSKEPFEEQADVIYM
ncbi:MAG: hypothetical protein ACO20W_01085 [Anaerohalosphaeraceae bacterium]